MKKNQHLVMVYLWTVLSLLVTATAFGQQVTVKGVVLDSIEDTPIVGVSILLNGSAITATDTEGRFTLTGQIGDVLLFRGLGYEDQQLKLTNLQSLTIRLNASYSNLEEVVVVGYGTQLRKDITGSISSISTSDFAEQPVTRMDQILQGRVAGVQVTNAAGAPGGDVRIRVRGSNSLSGDNDPLYVIDGFVGADFNTVNPDDVANIEVLKDASATAIYGSRGANGVIIVTTKTGKTGEAKIDFGLKYYSSTVLKKQNTLNAADFAVVANERRQASLGEGTTYTPLFTDAQIEGFRMNGGTDWQDEIFRTAPGAEYQLGISGGTEKVNYLVSGNYLTQDGIIRNSDFKRYSLRTNLSTKLSEKLSARIHLLASRRENLNSGGTSARSGALAQALAWAPTTPVRDENGKYILYDPTSSLFSNPLAVAYDNEYRSENSVINMVGGLKYNIIEGLSLDIQGGVNYENAQGKGFSGIESSRSFASASRSSGENITWQNTNTLNYNRRFNEDHSLDIIAVLELQKFTGTGFNVDVSDLTYPSQKYDNIALSASNIIGSGYGSWSLLSQLGRANYSYKDKYLVSATIRRDGSSKFQGDNKYSVFPSFSLGWNVSDEAFMQNLTIVNNLKLRGSWGKTGSQGIGSYGTLSSYVTNTDDAGVIFDGNGQIVNGILLGNPGNQNLKWETTEQTNVGIDLQLLTGRIDFSADYFVKNTRDLLMLRDLPGYIGGYSIQSNIGQIRNKGWEFAVSATIVNGTDFQWNSSLNYSLLDNKVISLGADRDTIPVGEYVLIPGHSMNSFWGYEYLGTWKPNEAAEAAEFGQLPGGPRYEDLDNNKVFDDSDFQVIGSGTPRNSLGWNNTISYKRLTMNIFLQGLTGFNKLNYTYAYGMVGSTDAREIIFADIKDRYIPGVNETSNIPAFQPSNVIDYSTIVQSSRFIEKGDFLRLKNISLSYDLPAAMIKNIAGVRFFVSATNLFTITNYKGIDPESNSSAVGGLTWDNYVTDVQQGTDYGSYPNSKTFTAGINFIF